MRSALNQPSFFCLTLILHSVQSVPVVHSGGGGGGGVACEGCGGGKYVCRMLDNDWTGLGTITTRHYH